MRKLNITPVLDCIIVEPLKKKETAAGIIIPTVSAEKITRGIILATGPGRLVKGVRQTLSVKVGDVVFFNKYTGVEIVLDDVDLYVIRENDIIGIFNNY